MILQLPASVGLAQACPSYASLFSLSVKNFAAWAGVKFLISGGFSHIFAAFARVLTTLFCRPRMDANNTLV